MSETDSDTIEQVAKIKLTGEQIHEFIKAISDEAIASVVLIKRDEQQEAIRRHLLNRLAEEPLLDLAIDRIRKGFRPPLANAHRLGANPTVNNVLRYLYELEPHTCKRVINYALEPEKTPTNMLPESYDASSTKINGFIPADSKLRPLIHAVESAVSESINAKVYLRSLEAEYARLVEWSSTAYDVLHNPDQRKNEIIELIASYPQR